MTNLGIANVRAKLINPRNLQNAKGRQDFDLFADAWALIKNNSNLPPVLLEGFSSDGSNSGRTFSYIGLGKRESYANNFMNTTNSASAQESDPASVGLSEEEPFVVWREVNPSTLGPTQGDAPENSDGGGENPPQPKWREASLRRNNLSSDNEIIEALYDDLGIEDLIPSDLTPQSDDQNCPLPNVSYIHQTVAEGGLKWGVQSDNFRRTPNMGFALHIIPEPPPTSEVPPFIYVGIPGNGSNYVVKIGWNSKPLLIDYQTNNSVLIPPDVEEANVYEGGDIHMRFEIVAGRLVITFNNYVFFYTRNKKNESERMTVNELVPGGLYVLGANCAAKINVHPLAYAPVGAVALPIPNAEDLLKNLEGTTTSDGWAGVDIKNELKGSIAELPNAGDRKTSFYGVDCQTFRGYGGTVNPDGFGFHKKGTITVRPGVERSEDNELSSSESWSLLALSAIGTDADFAGQTIKYSFSPYYFRLKGGFEYGEETPDSGDSLDLSDLIISANETFSAPDYFHLEHNVTLECYNPNGVLNGLARAQTGIEVSFGWGSSNRTFTGVVMSVDLGKVAGKETATLNCSDYNVTLNQPIVNSPYYDGMIAYYAIKDCAERAGLVVEKKWENEDDYFLPAGYSFTKPAMRFNGTETLKNCILKMIQRFEAFYYFDEDGKMIVEKLPGGLFSEASSVSASFNSRPGENNNDTVLENYKITTDFNSTVNNISVLTIDRNTRNAIVVGKTASPSRISYKRSYLYDQPALGDRASARDYVEQLGRRMFYPIRRTTIKVAGGQNISPLSFFSVDGTIFRAMSVRRSFSADANDFTTTIEGEWLGGA